MLVSISTQVPPTGSCNPSAKVSGELTLGPGICALTELTGLDLCLDSIKEKGVKLLDPLVLLGLGAREPVFRVPFHEVDLVGRLAQ
jgi:hypothetical protein